MSSILGGDSSSWNVTHTAAHKYSNAGSNSKNFSNQPYYVSTYCTITKEVVDENRPHLAPERLHRIGGGAHRDRFLRNGARRGRGNRLPDRRGARVIRTRI